METYQFNTKDVESQLVDVRAALQLLEFAIYGLNKIDLLEKQETTSFQFIIGDAKDKINAIIKSMKPVKDR